MDFDALIPDERLVPHLEEIRAHAPKLDPPVHLNLRNSKWGGALTRYLLLEHRSDLLANDDLTSTTLFYSRYYWLKRFVESYTANHSPDAGLEQQVFELLARAPEDVDWAIVEKLDAQATADARFTP